MKKPFRLYIEQDDGTFKYNGSYATTKSAWKRGWSGPDRDFAVFRGERRIIFDEHGASVRREERIDENGRWEISYAHVPEDEGKEGI